MVCKDSLTLTYQYLVSVTSKIPHGQGSLIPTLMLITNTMNSHVRRTCLNQTQLQSRHLYVSCMWLDVDLRTDTKEMCVQERIELHAQQLLTIIGSIVNMIRGNLHGHLTSMRIFTLISNKIFT